ncbi:MAG: hypothetical protein NTW78_00345 [Campylobacterales bacterium]|nr:hypothetical protein [Campylobacterales bacterium]
MKNTKKVALCLSAFALFSTGSLFGDDTNATKVKENIVTIELPKVPDVPKVEATVPNVKVVENGNMKPDETLQEILTPKKVIFSDHVAPSYYPVKKEINTTKVEVGDIDNGRVAAYLHSPLLSVEQVKSNLEKAGFTVLAEYKLDDKSEVVSIVFSDKRMEEAAAKKSRGFASTLRVLIDTQNKIVNISNPIYVMGAFLQEEYNSNIAQDALNRIRENFEGLKNSEDIVKFSVLEHFQFMENMPFYKDMQVVATGTNDELLAKAKASNKIVYEQHLGNGTIVLGVELEKRTSKFVKKIGYLNGGLLPYPVTIENGEAKILEPRFYISVMYPMIKMSEFMTIATVPGAITADCDKLFR